METPRLVAAGSLRLLALGRMASLPADLHLQDRIKVMEVSQHGLTKGKACLTSLIATYDKVASSVDWMRSVRVLSLDFCKAVTLPSIISL